MMDWQRRLEELRQEQGSPKATYIEEERPRLRITYGPPPGWEPDDKKVGDKPKRVIIIDL